MFLIPIGHEQETVRRLPWITFGILALCFALHIFVSMGVKDATTQVGETARELINYYISHPYLEFDPETTKALFSGVEDENMEQILGYYQQSVSRPRLSIREKEKEEFKRLSQNFISALNDFPYRKWGFIPADKTVTALITYMFIHGGWLHLLGNLLFLYLTGPFIEDLWGKPLFASFYLVAGMVSALLYAQHYPNFNGPLIGASGAIAGVMGAFLIKYWKIKIRFFYFIFPIFRGTFSAPAWLMLPLWVVLELFNAKIIDSFNTGGGGGGVAHWAHIWGFVVGMVVALGITRFKVEEKHIKPKIDAKILARGGGFDVVAQAIRVKNLGMVKDAHTMLLDEAIKNPGQKEVIETLWEFGHELEDSEDSTMPPMLLQNFASIALKLSPALAEKAIEICLQHPEIPGENKDNLKKQLLELNPNMI